MTYDLAGHEDREDRRKHLELIVGTVHRLASTSAAIKGWGVTIAGASLGLAAGTSRAVLLLAGLLVIVSFAAFDAMNLRNERRFREMHARVIENRWPELSLDVSQINKPTYIETVGSWSVVGFYGPIVLLGALLAWAAL